MALILTHDGQANEAKICSARLLGSTHFDGIEGCGHEVWVVSHDNCLPEHGGYWL